MGMKLVSSEMVAEPKPATEIMQIKMNGKNKWGAKINGTHVWKNGRAPVAPVFEVAEVPGNFLRSNNSGFPGTPSVSGDRIWSCMPYSIANLNDYENPVIEWEVVPTEVAPFFPEDSNVSVDEDGRITAIATPVAGPSVAYLAFKLKCTIKTRFGVVSAMTDAKAISIVVAPTISLRYAPAAYAKIGSTHNSSLAYVYGTSQGMTVDYELCAGISLVKSTDTVYQFRGTYVHDASDWGETDGLAIPQHITATNEAGSWTIDWTIERRQMWGDMVVGLPYKLAAGARWGISNNTQAAFSSQDLVYTTEFGRNPRFHFSVSTEVNAEVAIGFYDDGYFDEDSLMGSWRMVQVSAYLSTIIMSTPRTIGVSPPPAATIGTLYGSARLKKSATFVKAADSLSASTMVGVNRLLKSLFYVTG